MARRDRETAPMIMRRRTVGLSPASGYDLELLERYPMDSMLEVHAKRYRSLPQLRKYWRTLHKVVQATEAYPSAEALHEVLKFELGHTTPIKRLNGEVFYVTDSAALSSMDAITFSAYYDKAMQTIADHFGINPDDLMREGRE